MKQSIIILTMFLTQSIFSQTITGLSISPTTEGIGINLTSYDANVFEYGCSDYSINGNIILLKVGYYLTASPSSTERENNFEIALANDENDYTFQIEIYSADNYPNCTYDTITDSESLSFSTPLAETITLSNSEHTDIKEQISFYPNPVRNTLSLELPNTTIKEIKIYTALGEEVVKTTHKKIDVSHFSNGIYIVKITTNENNIITKKIIKAGM